MERTVQSTVFSTPGIRVRIEDKGKDIAHAYVYILKNDLHERPFGFIEDVFVSEEYR